MSSGGVNHTGTSFDARDTLKRNRNNIAQVESPCFAAKMFDTKRRADSYA